MINELKSYVNELKVKQRFYWDKLFDMKKDFRMDPHRATMLNKIIVENKKQINELEALIKFNLYKKIKEK